MIDRHAPSRIGTRTGRDQLKHVLVRAAYFSARASQQLALFLVPAGVSHLGGPCCL